MLCPIMSYHKEYVSEIGCEGDECGFYDTEEQCCAAVAVAKALKSVKHKERQRNIEEELNDLLYQ